MRAFLAALLLCIACVPLTAEAVLVRDLPTVSRRYSLRVQRSRRIALAQAQRLLQRQQRTAERLRVRTRPASPIISNVPVGAQPMTVPSISTITVQQKQKAVPNRPLYVPVELEEIQAEVLRLTNIEREEQGLVPLRPDALLQRTAQGYALDMATRDFFAHRDPEGRASLDRIRDSGYLDPPCDCTWSYVTGENIAHGQKTPQEVVRAWMDSPAHRENILEPRFIAIGIGFYDGYWVQNFGTVTVDGQ